MRSTVALLAASALGVTLLATTIASPAGAATKRYTMAQVKAHKQDANCWTTINGGVYDLTTWVTRHPGGAAVIRGLCGTNGTAAFTATHGKTAGPSAQLAKYRIGSLVASPAAKPTVKPSRAATGASGTLGAAVSKHRTAANCWTIVQGNVYDLTSWISRHPGGGAPITAMCGIDATAAFSAKHGLSGTEAAKLAAFRLGAKTDPVAKASASPSASAADASFTAAQVASHAAANNCWVVIDGSVYNLTKWISRHPGGQRVIVSACGLDASAVFASERAHARAGNQATLATFRLGAFDASAGGLPTSTSYDD